MKNQYFGDVHDFRKYGLLRVLTSTGLSLGVGWMLTPDDSGPDGKMKRYLAEPGKWQDHDPILYGFLKSLQDKEKSGGVELIEKSGLLRRARFYSDIVPDSKEQRELWSAGLQEKLKGADIVFLDPDNGMMVSSKRVGLKDSSKYADWSEVECLWRGGSSLLIYQHYPHQPREEFRRLIAQKLQEVTGARRALLFSTSQVLFVLLIQEHHKTAVQESLQNSFDLWEGQITMTSHQANKATEVLTQRLIAICDANDTWYEQCRETWVDTDQLFGADSDWVEKMLNTADETDEVREALGTGSLSDALVAVANHFGWEKEESNEGSQAAPLVSLASALATKDPKLVHIQLIADADPDEVAYALVDRLKFLAQNNETWRENLRNVFHQIEGKIEEPETEWIVEALDSDNEEPQVRNALINSEAIEIAVFWVAILMNWI